MFNRTPRKHRAILTLLQENPGTMYASPLGDRIYAIINGKLHYINGNFLNMSKAQLKRFVKENPPL